MGGLVQVSETDNRAAPVDVLDLSLQNWGNSLGLGQGFQKRFQKRGGDPLPGYG